MAPADPRRVPGAGLLKAGNIPGRPRGEKESKTSSL